MVEVSACVSFSIVLSDGVKECYMDNVIVYPSLTYRNFKSVLSNKIGMSPDQFSTYFCNSSNFTSESESTMLITGNVNFSVMMKDKYGCFLVVLKRRKDMRRKRENKKNPPFNRILRRRNTPGVENQPFSWFRSKILDRVGYDKWKRNLQIERERFLVNMRLANLHLESLNKENKDLLLNCAQCWKAWTFGRRDDEFHCCICDPVIVGFRSTAGLIAGPTKRSESYTSCFGFCRFTLRFSGDGEISLDFVNSSGD